MSDIKKRRRGRPAKKAPIKGGGRVPLSLRVTPKLKRDLMRSAGDRSLSQEVELRLEMSFSSHILESLHQQITSTLDNFLNNQQTLLTQTVIDIAARLAPASRKEAIQKKMIEIDQWGEEKRTSKPMRSKEAEEDYIPPYLREIIRNTAPIVEEAVRRAMETGESVDDLLGLKEALPLPSPELVRWTDELLESAAANFIETIRPASIK